MPSENPKYQKLTLPVARGSYCNIFKPRAAKDGDPAKYSISLLWEKDDEKKLAPLKKAVDEVAIANFGPNAVALMKKGKLHSPLRDGDEDKPEADEYKNKLFANASSKRQPGLVDRKLEEILDEKEAYSGCYYRAAVTLYGYDVNGNKGVALGLNNLQMVKQGDRLDGGKSAAEEFAEFVEEDDGEEAAPAKKTGKKAAEVEDDEEADID